jgi:leucyl aminopeptidase (aminopeptidase T)
VASTRPPPRSRTPFNLRLNALDFDLAQAARRVVEGSLGVVAGDRLVIVVDEAREALGAALSDAAIAVGGQPEVAVIERFGRRPLRAVPPPLRALLGNAQASVLLVSFEDGELEMRRELVNSVTELQLRHAHMVGLGRKAMLTGFSVDPQRVLDATRAVRMRLRPDSVLRLRSPLGSDLTVKLHPTARWQERVGLIRPGRWENLPSGELFTCPADVHGVYYANASLGGAVGAAAGLVERTPVRFEIKAGVCKSVQCADRGLAGSLENALRAERNSDRVGMAVLGTNVGIRDATGEAICDQNLPGMHLGFGATFAAQTGATWDSPTQLLCTSSGGDVDLDGVPLLRNGRYLVL